MSVTQMSRVWNLPPSVLPSQRLVLLALADHADRVGCCWPGIDGISTMVGLKERQVQYVVRHLEEAGYVERRQRFSETGRQTSNYYLLHLPATADSGEGAPHCTLPGAPHCTPGVTPTAPSPVHPTAPSYRTKEEEPTREPSEGRTPLVRAIAAVEDCLGQVGAVPRTHLANFEADLDRPDWLECLLAVCVEQKGKVARWFKLRDKIAAAWEQRQAAGPDWTFDMGQMKWVRKEAV